MTYAPFDYKESQVHKLLTDELWANGYKAGFRGQKYQNPGRTQDEKMFYRDGYKKGSGVRAAAR
jgi:hypothetical protein